MAIISTPAVTRTIGWAALFVFVFAVSPTPALWANVTGEGDVSPTGPDDLPIGGGTVTDDVIVGDTDIGQLTINAPAFTDPLESPNGFIGRTATGYGLVSVSGFDLDRSEWLIRGGDLVVAGAGYGELQISSGGRVSTATALDTGGMPTGNIGDAFIGQDFSSQAIVNISGFASVLEVDDLTVAEFSSSANVSVFSRGTIRSTNTIVGKELGSVGQISLSGLGTRWLNAEEVMLGVTGRATLQISDDAIAMIGELDSTSTGSEKFTDGLTDIGGLGRVELAGGRLLTYDLNNAGVIRGYGTLQATNSLVITSTGALRNQSGTFEPRERLYVADPNVTVTNNGTIESLGGEMEFEGPVANASGAGTIVARDAVMRFNNGLTNDGNLALGGETTLYGDVTSTGELLVLAGSESLLVGNLSLTSGVLGLAIGDNTGTLDVVGGIDLGGVALELFYSGGVLSQPGDSYQILSATEAITGSFSNTQALADGRLWDITGLGTSAVFVTATGATLETISADFDSDGDVDGSDFLTWQRGFSTGNTFAEGDATLNAVVDGIDLTIWESQFGTGVPPLSATSAVPEPSGGLLAMVAAAMGFSRRRRR